MSWRLQEAERRFSELVRRVLEKGPQVVTRCGEEVVVVVPAEEYRRMTGREGGEKMDFKEFLMSAPEGLEHAIPERQKMLPRDIELQLGWAGPSDALKLASDSQVREDESTPGTRNDFGPA